MPRTLITKLWLRYGDHLPVLKHCYNRWVEQHGTDECLPHLKYGLAHFFVQASSYIISKIAHSEEYVIAII